MKPPIPRPLVLLWALVVFFGQASLPAASATPRVLYLHGDVAADGTVPSGSADSFHQMRLDDTGSCGLSQFKAALEEAGVIIEDAYDATLTLGA